VYSSWSWTVKAHGRGYCYSILVAIQPESTELNFIASSSVNSSYWLVSMWLLPLHLDVLACNLLMFYTYGRGDGVPMNPMRTRFSISGADPQVPNIFFPQSTALISPPSRVQTKLESHGRLGSNIRLHVNVPRPMVAHAWHIGPTPSWASSYSSVEWRHG
jgi:hypothetical protein